MSLIPSVLLGLVTTNRPRTNATARRTRTTPVFRSTSLRRNSANSLKGIDIHAAISTSVW